MFVWYQFAKDFCGLPFYLSLCSKTWSRTELAVTFSFLSTINTIFVAASFGIKKPTSVACYKDRVYAFGYWILCAVMLFVPFTLDPKTWNIFFVSVVVIDMIFVTSLLWKRNLYSVKVDPPMGPT